MNQNQRLNLPFYIVIGVAIVISANFIRRTKASWEIFPRVTSLNPVKDLEEYIDIRTW